MLSPIQLALEPGGIDGVAAIMARPILDEGDEVVVRSAFGVNLIHDGADGGDDVDVGLFAVAANVVGLAGNALGKNEGDCFAMISDIEPVADVESVSKCLRVRDTAGSKQAPNGLRAHNAAVSEHVGCGIIEGADPLATRAVALT